MLRAFVLAASMLGLASGAHASSDPVRSAAILQGWQEDGGVYVAALDIRLAPGWKTYWRAPGEGGLPPEFNWSGSSNLDGVTVSFPVPELLDQAGFRTVGYEGGVTLPLRVRAEDPSREVRLRGDVLLGACYDICVPMTLRLDTVLRAGEGPRAADVRAAIADRPMSASDASVAGVECRIKPISDGLRLDARIVMPSIGRDEFVVIETADPTVWVAGVDSARTGGAIAAGTDLVSADGEPFLLARKDIRFTVIAEGRAVDIRGCD